MALGGQPAGRRGAVVSSLSEVREVGKHRAGEALLLARSGSADATVLEVCDRSSREERRDWELGREGKGREGPDRVSFTPRAARGWKTRSPRLGAVWDHVGRYA